jgi:transposase
VYVENLHRLRFNNRWIQESFERLLESYQFLSLQIVKQTQLIRELAKTDTYKERIAILCSVPGIGVLSAIELLVELQDVSRFRRADHIAAYVGLTPSQYSSGEKVRMGRISRVGKNTMRGILVEAAWMLIRKDVVMRAKYDRIKAHSGSKRAIVAVARTLLICTRRMLLDGQPYLKKVAA